MTDGFDKRYSWDEIDDIWQKRYNFLSQKLGIPVDKIISSRKQLLVAFGEDWIKKSYQRKTPQKSGIPIRTKSNIIQIISNPIENNAFDIVEMATYFGVFYKQPNFNLVVGMLKDGNSFEAARLSLAVAYRFFRNGFSEISLEPDIPRGKGDIHAKYEAQKFLVECSILEEEKLSDYFRERLFVRLQNSIRDRVLGVGIEVSFIKPPTQKEVDETIASIGEARHKFGKFETNSELKPILFSSSVADGRVFKLEDKDKTIPPPKKALDKWDAIFGIDTAKMKEKDNIYSADIENAEVNGRLYIKGLAILDDKEKFYDRIKTKLETKIVQTHGLDNSIKRIFVVMAQNRVEKYNYKKIWEKIRPSFKSRPNVGALFFVCRWQSILDDKKMRYAYPLILFENPFYSTPELQEVFPELEKFERSDWIAN